jgi:signal transduction histidine kinase
MSTRDEPLSIPQPTPGRPWRWWGVVAGLAFALPDTFTLSWLGVAFEMNGREAGWLIVLWFGSSFALLGFLVGYLVESRHRERQSAAIIRSQMEAIHETRARLAEAERLAALGQLATAIAHEVRNPLAVIRSATQGLAEATSPEDDEIRRACGFMTAEIDRLTSVVSSLLAFARPPRLELREVGVRELFDRVELLAKHELGSRRIRLENNAGAGAPSVTADADLLSQVLLGLIDNARDALSAGGRVILETAVRDGEGEIAVADDGPGVAPELRERIFDPFFTTRARGIGLGLAVARQIVEAHGGRLEAGERPGGGARFTIRLPLARGRAMAA